jgi:hypothetical protein
MHSGRHLRAARGGGARGLRRAEPRGAISRTPFAIQAQSRSRAAAAPALHALPPGGESIFDFPFGKRGHIFRRCAARVAAF